MNHQGTDQGMETDEETVDETIDETVDIPNLDQDRDALSWG
jgi:hypothetical protein